MGALEIGSHNSAGVAEGFGYGMGPAGVSFQSHATISNSGKETMHCEMFAPNGFTRPLKISGELCGLFFGV